MTPPEVGWNIIGPTLAVTLIATVAILLRLYTRRIILYKLHGEDYLIALCLICAWTNTSVIVAGMHQTECHHGHNY